MGDGRYFIDGFDVWLRLPTSIILDSPLVMLPLARALVCDKY